MASEKKHITTDNLTEWLASTGFLFPRNELELARFERLYSESKDTEGGKELDVQRIITGTFKQPKVVKMIPDEINKEDILKMVARKGSSIPNHIIEKMKKNQQSRKDDNSSEKKEDQ
jgi:hypothetical protein